MINPTSARTVMVNNQIRTFDVTDPDVLAAFESVPREVFVAAQDRALAYSDAALSVEGRALLTPLVLARLLQALEPVAGERALDCLSGTGYPAALLGAMGLKTDFLEANPVLVAKAQEAFKQLAAEGNSGAGVSVLPAQPGLTASTSLAGPYDVIVVGGTIAVEPTGLIGALAEGGRLGVLRREGGVTRAVVYVKSGNTASPRRIFDAESPDLPGFEAPQTFVF